MKMSEIIAASGQASDKQEAVNQAIIQGISVVRIPEGDFDFQIPPDNIGMEGSPIGVSSIGGIDIIGQGMGKTILRQTFNAPRDSRMFMLDGGNGLRLRISGISFVGYVDLGETLMDYDILNSAMVIHGATDYRVDHCEFIDFAGSGVIIRNRHLPYGDNRGVIDHCIFNNPYKDRYERNRRMWGYGISPTGTGQSEDWNPDINHYLGKYEGVRDIVYIEDCTLSRCRHAIASNMGVWYVIRHCTIDESRPENYHQVDVHAGGRGLEAYNNEVIGTEMIGYGYIGSAMGIRGGGGVIYNNTIQDMAYGITLAKEGIEKYWIKDLWIWNNPMNMGELIKNLSDYIEGVDYFLDTPMPVYTPYQYPHPLVQELQLRRLTVNSNIDGVPFNIRRV